MTGTAATVHARFAALLDLYDTSVEIMRQNLRRRSPDASQEEIESRLRRWLVKADERDPVPWIIRKRAAS